MIDLFALARLQPGEQLESVHRSHWSRLASSLLVAAAFLAMPFFFLFDVRGWAWAIPVACWCLGAALLWLAFDVWSSSLVLRTSHRVVGAERSSWGRVRVHDWPLPASHRVPTWEAWRRFPWLGRLVWTRPDGVRLVLGWVPGPASADRAPSRFRRRRALIRRLRRADDATLARLEAVFDEQGRS